MTTCVCDDISQSSMPVVSKSGMYNLFEILFNKNNEHASKVRIKRPENVKKKLTRMMALGKNKIEVISDFDFTLSKFMHNGVNNPTSHGIFEEDPEMSAETQNKLRVLRETYRPIEVDNSIPLPVKIPIMIEWWDLTHKVIANSVIHKNTLRTTVNQSNLVLRDKAIEFIKTLHKNDIPLLIFSAGLGNVIELFLESKSICYDNIRVVSNFMDFNDDGILVGFQEPIIHSFNKTVATIANSDYNEKVISKRSCILLLGDSTEDPHMSDGFSNSDDENSPLKIVLKIGFLNAETSGLLDTYMNIYDIVLLDDGTFEIPLEVINCVIRSDSIELHTV